MAFRVLSLCALGCDLLSRVSIPVFGRFLLFAVASRPCGPVLGVSFRWYSL